MKKITISYPVFDVERTGKRIHELRIHSGYTVAQIQKFMNLPYPQAIYNWEKGRSCPSIDHLYALSALFEISIDQILCGSKDIILCRDRNHDDNTNRADDTRAA